MATRAIAFWATFLWPFLMTTPSISGSFPTPEGLRPCAPGDPVATIEARVASKLGGEFLNCFQSGRRIATPSAAKRVWMPVEYAFAIALQGQSYTLADLDNLLSKVKDQWSGFDPLSKQFKDNYTAKLNELLRCSGLNKRATIDSVKPVLVAIAPIHDKFYVVTSIRIYAFRSNGVNVETKKVNADAVVLRGSRLIRLTIQRTLSEPTDVTEVQAEIDKWAKMVAQG
jgi:hypothetical protein